MHISILKTNRFWHHSNRPEDAIFIFPKFTGHFFRWKYSINWRMIILSACEVRHWLINRIASFRKGRITHRNKFPSPPMHVHDFMQGRQLIWWWFHDEIQRRRQMWNGITLKFAKHKYGLWCSAILCAAEKVYLLRKEPINWMLIWQRKFPDRRPFIRNREIMPVYSSENVKRPSQALEQQHFAIIDT